MLLLLHSSDTKYKLINTRRGRVCGSRARAEGMDMRSLCKKKESCLFMNKLSPLGSKQHASRMRVAVSFVPPTHYRFIYRTTSQCRPVVTVAEPGGGKMRNVCNGRQLQYKNNRLQLEMLGCNCRIPGCNRSCSAAIVLRIADTPCRHPAQKGVCRYTEARAANPGKPDVLFTPLKCNVWLKLQVVVLRSRGCKRHV